MAMANKHSEQKLSANERDKLVIQLKRHEGHKRGKDGIHRSYKDTEGLWTIGYGRLIDPKRGGGVSYFEVRWLVESDNGIVATPYDISEFYVTEAGAAFLLANDIDRFVKEVSQKMPWVWDLDEVRRRVIIDMSFNLGTAGFLKFKNTIKAIRAQDWKAAQAGMLNSKWARQTKTRSVTLSKMMTTGEDPDWLSAGK